MKKLSFVVSLITQDNDYQIEQAASAEETAHRLGLDVQVAFADNDSIQQSQQVLKFIQSSAALPDGIIIESVSGTALPQVARAAAMAGIGWVVLNREAEYVHELRRLYQVPLFSVTSDNEEVGHIQGRQLEALLPQGGNILYIEGPSDSAAARLRSKGMMKTKPPGAQLKTMKGHWTEASAYKAVTAWLRLSTSQQTHIDVIAAQNDAMAMGARKAILELPNSEARERWLKLPYLGCDGVSQTGQTWVHDHLLAATVVIPPIAGQALEMLAASISTGTLPPELTQVAPRSFPALDALGKLRAVAPGLPSARSASAAKP
jgi:ribose transport system substrate-binding protein